MQSSPPLLPRTLLCLNEAFLQVNGVYHCASVWWRFARHLARYCESMTINAPLTVSDDPGDAMPVTLDDIKLVGRPYYRRFVQYYRRLPHYWPKVRSQAYALAKEHDVVICRVPDPAAGTISRAVRSAGRPLVMFVGGDVGIGSMATEGGSRIARGVGNLLARWMRHQEGTIARRSALVGIWDTQMRDRFETDCPRVEAFQSPNLTLDMLYERSDTCEATPIRLLRVCQLEPVKGLETLFEAVARLVKAGRDIQLDIAGGVTRPVYTQQLHEYVARMGLQKRVSFLGNIKFGPALFDLYRRSDIHIISSKWEGLPRCLAEARASSVPTVATAVGGIVGVVRDGEDGLLVPPGDAEALAAAIARLIDDAALRRGIIRQGFALAPQSTAEFHSRRIAETISTVLHSTGSGLR